MKTRKSFDFPSFYEHFYGKGVKMYRYDIVCILLLGHKRNECESLGISSLGDSAVSVYTHNSNAIKKEIIANIFSSDKKEIKNRMKKIPIVNLDQKIVELIAKLPGEYLITRRDMIQLNEIQNSSDDPYDLLLELFLFSLQPTEQMGTEEYMTHLPEEINEDKHTFPTDLNAGQNTDTIPDFLIKTVNCSSIHILDEKKYANSFYGYMYSPKPTSKEIIQFELDIVVNGYLSSVHMTYHGFPIIDGKPVEDKRDLYGVPYIDTLHNNIFFSLLNNNGDFYFMTYNCQTLRSHNFRFSRGLAVTPTSKIPNAPMQQSFILTNKIIPIKKRKYLCGLLTNTGGTLTISSDNAEMLRRKSPAIDTLFQKLGFLLDHNKATCYTISESEILSSLEKEVNSDEVIEALLQLREYSYSPSRIVYEDIDAVEDFFVRQIAAKK